MTADEFEPQAKKLRDEFIGDADSGNVAIADIQIERIQTSTVRVSGTPADGISKNYGFPNEAPFQSRKEIRRNLDYETFSTKVGGGHFDGEVQILTNIARALETNPNARG